METLLAAVIFYLLGGITGLYMRDITDKLQELQRKASKSNKTQRPQSAILEPPLTPAEKVAREQEELLERLNP
jgi:hypothetical protein